MNIKELELKIFSLIRFAMDKHSIVKAMSSDVEDVRMLEEAVDRTCESYPDYDLIQFFGKSKIISDKDGEDDILYMYNPLERKVKTIDRSRLSSMISSKLDWNHRRHTCDFVYDPLTPYKLKKVGKDWKFNLYQAPEWADEHFHSGGKKKLPVITEMPKIYKKFLMHLVNNDKKSYMYIVDWLANMVQGRNYCILTTIGNQGIGKGVLGETMRELVGSDNYVKTDNKIIEKDFNGQIRNKRLIYLNEVKVNNTSQENKLKGLVDDDIEVENKGIDAKMMKNYSSIYFSSNNLDAVKIPSDDRRFSIVMLTDEKLINVMTEKEIQELYQNKDNIAELGYYLSNHKVDPDAILRVFRSDRTEVIRSASLNAWQEWFLEEWIPDNKGKTFPIREITAVVEDEFGSNCRPGRGALQNLEQFYPEIFKVKSVRDVKNKDKRIWSVEFF